MATVLPFMHTEGTLKRRIARECAEQDKTMMDKAAWMYQMSAGYQDMLPMTDEERELWEQGVYEP